MRLKLHSSLRAAGFFVAILGAPIAFVVACSPDFSGFGFGGAGSPGGASTATGDRRSPEPPEPCDRANEGSSCSSSRAELCEKGDAANASCNVTLRCGDVWIRDQPRDCALECPPAFAPDASPDLCEIERASTLLCEYAQGTCGCAPRRQAPDGGDGGDGDAAVEDAGSEDAGDAGDAGARRYVWRCVGLPAPGCPKTRPRLGSTCVKPMVCDYGACVFDDGIEVECLQRHWVQALPTCDDH